MSPSCPISRRSVDANIVRTISLFVTLTSLAFLLTANNIFAYLLLIDFSLRLFRLNHLSPFFQLSLGILKMLNIQPRMSNEAPKRFALYLGWSIAIMIVTLIAFGLTHLTLYLVAILLVCASLEMLFEYCIGCKLYQYLNIAKFI